MKLVLSTCSSQEASGLARQLVQERLAACCNLVGNVASIYWWNDALTEEQETLLLFKTADDALPALLDRLKALHPYQTPEILAFEAVVGFEPYLAWIERETRRDAGNGTTIGKRS